MVQEIKLKVVIVREAPESLRQLIVQQFPADWQIAVVSPQSLIDEIGDADALIPEGTRIDAALLEHAKNLKIIQTGAGCDNVDIAECSRRGVKVANASGINARAVAERFRFFAKNIARAYAGKPVLNELQSAKGREKKVGDTIPKVILPEGYSGKILLVSVSGDGIEEMVILRSGDLWHREILRNTQQEIRDLGFKNARVNEVGGAHLRFENNGTIIIHGFSQQYGACDKQYAAKLVRAAFEGRQVAVEF
jgi:hypothetical protein